MTTYQHTTNYTAMAQTHSNYPFQAYQNSMPNDMNIVGEFIVQNWEDARYWVATVNFLRAVHKMFFGGSDDNKFKGNPPPILHMSGYGDHMFDKVPVVLNNFNVDLRAGIDYICTQQDSNYGGYGGSGGSGGGGNGGSYNSNTGGGAGTVNTGSGGGSGTGVNGRGGTGAGGKGVVILSLIHI